MTNPCYMEYELRLDFSAHSQQYTNTMRVSSLIAWLPLAAGLAAGEQTAGEVETHRYQVRFSALTCSRRLHLTFPQSDIAKLRSIVIHSLYSQKDIFLRELLSNSQDALEKLRLTSLTEGSFTNLDGWQGNITIEARRTEDGRGGQLVVRDTGIGMTKAELGKNLGTIAKSGTLEFLKNASDATEGSNLIGQFGTFRFARSDHY